MLRPFPAVLAWLGVPAIVCVWQLALRLVLERTVRAWERGAEVLDVLSMQASGLRTLLALAVAVVIFLWPVAVLWAAAMRRNIGGKKVIIMLAMYAAGWSLALTPYSFWQRVFVDQFSPRHAIELMVDAARNGDVRTVRAFLDNGTLVDSQGTLGTALHAAAEHSELEVMQHLVSRGADVNARGRWGMTPLHIAAFHADVAVMEYLISCGADVNVINALGDSPMAKALQAREMAREQSSEALALLAKHGAMPVVGTDEQRSKAFEKVREAERRTEAEMPK
jgi:Ankyrin repeats (3 copies)